MKNNRLFKSLVISIFLFVSNLVSAEYILKDVFIDFDKKIKTELYIDKTMIEHPFVIVEYLNENRKEIKRLGGNNG
jgi:hypothetical protein